MENERQRNTTGEWVDGLMGELDTPGDFQPNAERGLERVRERCRKASEWRRAWGWAAAAASTICVVAFVIPATRAAVFRACTAACAVVFPEVVANEPQNLGATLEILQPTVAPDFTLPDAGGRIIKLSDFRGQVVLVNFWATWCPPCKAEMPSFVELQRKYRDRGFTIVAISLDADGWAAVKPFVDGLQPNFPVLLDDDTVGNRFGGVDMLPVSFLIDKEGQIFNKYEGLVNPKEYEDAIEGLL